MWRPDKLQIMFIVMRYTKLYTLTREWLLYNYSCVTNIKTKSRVTKQCRVYRMRPSHTRELLWLFGYVWFVFENRNGWLHKLCTSVTSKTFKKCHFCVWFSDNQWYLYRDIGTMMSMGAKPGVFLFHHNIAVFQVFHGYPCNNYYVT
jgi:hypothetical protein